MDGENDLNRKHYFRHALVLEAGVRAEEETYAAQETARIPRLSAQRVSKLYVVGLQ